MAKLKYINDPNDPTAIESPRDILGGMFGTRDSGVFSSPTSTSVSSGAKREWSNDEITNLVGTVATGASQLISSFSFLKKPSYQDEPSYSYYPSYNNSGSSSLIWIIGGVAVLALVLFIALKK